jgi:hypothetical protein
MRQAMDRRTLLRASAAGVGATVLLPGVASATSGLPEVAGMLGDRKANEFWYQFDQATRFAPSDEILAAYGAIQDHIGGSLVQTFRDVWLDMSAAAEYPNNFTSFVTPIKEPLELLSRTQLGVMDQFYRPNSPEFVEAFALFGQGVLFDPRRAEVESEVHTMDRTPPIGYHGWHSYLRAMMFLGISTARWARIDAVIAFAWAIQSTAKPNTRTVSQPLPPATLAHLAYKWLPKTPTQLDKDFRTIPFPVGIS